ncbi:citrate synthase [Ruaniaceae bacterium KH17]|nr:citrate synthase [Ruaniaceae bacterium KH17]
MTSLDARLGDVSAELPVTDGTIRATELKQFATDRGPLMTYDPGFANTAACRSSITFIDGDAGILEYRGYPIEQLAKESTFLETAYLLLGGQVPVGDELTAWVDDVNHHRLIHENVKDIIKSFRYDAHPMSKLMAAVASLMSFYPESRDISNADIRFQNTVRLLAKMPTIAAYAYRHSLGREYVQPVDDLGFVENFLAMMFKQQQRQFAADPRLVKAVEVLFILHADHEQNCSTTAVRTVASAGNDPYTSIGAGIGALFGPAHGGANEAVLKMLREINSVDNVPEFIEGVKNGKGRLMGFGHRVYKNYDPRARVIKAAADDVFEVTGVNPLLRIAVELEKIALEDEYFISRKLYPNVDFYSGLIYEALGLPPEMFTVMFAVPRTAGWLAQWEEQVSDPDQRIIRPQQIYTGARALDYIVG